MAHKMNIHKGDLVQVISGKDKGLQGKVVQAFPETQKVIVEGVNRVKKHEKVGQTARGAKTGTQLKAPGAGRPTDRAGVNRSI